MKKLVSIVIPNWNGIKFIKVCLESVLQSTFTNYEVIVVDNGSTDGSRELVEDLFHRVGGTEGPPTRCTCHMVRLSKNLGFARACNEGIKAAEGKYVVLLNNDVEVEKTWLRELVEGMERHPECGMGTSKMVQYDNREQLYNTGDLFNIWCTGGARGFGEIDCGQYDEEDYIFGACAGAGIYKKSLFKRIGLFDEDFFIFSEDVDLNIRAQCVGERCIFLPKAVVYHWGTATVGFHSNRHVFLGARNDLFVLVKNYTLREFIKYFIKIFTHQYKLIKVFSLEGQGCTILRSRLSFLFYLPSMFLKRIFVISKRNIQIDEIPEIIKNV